MIKYYKHPSVTYVHHCDNDVNYSQYMGRIHKIRFGFHYTPHRETGMRAGWRPTYKWARRAFALHIRIHHKRRDK